MAKDMKTTSILSYVAIIILTTCLASGALSSPNLAKSPQSALVETESFSMSSAPSINVIAIDTGLAAHGNSRPVNITVNVTQIMDSPKSAEAICGLDRFNFETDMFEVPSDGKDARIMSVSPTYAGYMNPPAPCSYWISIIPIADYLNQGSPANPSPAKQNTWVNGCYTLQLKYLNGGNEIASKTFSFTIGGSPSLGNTIELNRISAINSKRSPYEIDPIDQLNPQPEPPRPLNPSFLRGKAN
ncbi:MAG: hypothetical protein HGA93_04345 [Methanothrix sp.]|nr:hypothetical protein [Methanothrix sp.]